jgi:hypothetical protein
VKEDPHVELERLHDQWSTAYEQVEEIMAQWRTRWGDNKLKERYYAAQEKASTLVQQIMEHKRKHGL